MSESAEVLALAQRATRAFDRPDLAERLATVAARTAADSTRVLVLGAFKSGKTELVNALLAARVLPSHLRFATTVPTVVAHAATPAVRLVRAGADPTSTVEKAIEPAALAEHVTEKGNDDNGAGWSHAAVGLPRKLLAAGLVLVDTPGAGGLGSPATVSSMVELAEAEAVLLVSDAGREFTGSDMALLKLAAAVCPVTIAVLTRTDLHPHWRRIRELDLSHLAREGLAHVEVLATSSTLRLDAAARKEEADADSGVGTLTTRLLSDAVGGRDGRRARLVADEVLAVCGQLAATFRAELAAIADPRQAERVAHDLEAGRVRTAKLRDRAARWQQTLNDGVADLVSDIEYDLRDRLRTVVADAEPRLDDTDPVKTWDQFAPWLQQQVSAAVSTNMIWAETRTRWLAERVAQHFAEEGEGAVPGLDLPGGEGDGGDGGADVVALLAAPDHEKVGLGSTLITGMRGSYGGVLMIGMLSTIGGLALINPFSVGAGLLLGSKTFVDERKRARRRRQSEAKTAVRRHVDDVTFQAGKNSRDMLREVQRLLRDHFTTTAAELDRSLAVAAAAATKVEGDRAKRERRRADLEAELGRIDTLAGRARALRPAVAGASS